MSAGARRDSVRGPGWFRSISLRARLMVVGVAGLAGALLILGVGLYVLLGVTVDRALDSEARARAQEVATMVADDRLPDPIPVSGAQLIQVVDGDRRVIGGSLLADRLTPLLRADELARALTGQAVIVPGSRIGLSGPLRVTALAAGRGDYSVVVAQQVGDVLAGRRILRVALGVVFPLLLLVAALIAWRVIGWTLRPVEQLRTGAERISGGTAHEQLPVPEAKDEIQALALTLNTMLDRLAAARERQRAFVADAAHELRSPLTSLRTQLEVAERLGEGGEWTADLMADTDRLAALIEDLLLLARSDADRRGPAVVETVDVAELVQQQGQRSGAVAVVTEADHDVVVRADPGELRRAVTNLVDNAVRHAASRVEVSGVRAGPQVLIMVTDDGPGIAAADRERVFDRFTRLDDARARDAGGSGLGLAITRELVQRTGGTVVLQDSPSGAGLRAVITLPAADHAVVTDHDQQSPPPV